MDPELAPDAPLHPGQDLPQDTLPSPWSLGEDEGQEDEKESHHGKEAQRRQDPPPDSLHAQKACPMERWT
jgi:hypothetical protein